MARPPVSSGLSAGNAPRVTVTNPQGNPNLLETVIRTDHRRLASVIVEAARGTATTPGERQELVESLRLSMARHLNTEIALVHPEVASALDQRLADHLHEDTSDLGKLFDVDPWDWDLDRVEAVLQRHADLYEELLSRLRTAVGDRRMATLGYEFGRAADTAPDRPMLDQAIQPRTDSPRRPKPRTTVE